MAMSQMRALSGQNVLSAFQATKVRTSRRTTVTPRNAVQHPPLPYATDALESKGMSKETMEIHHGKHHAAYVTNLNKQIEGKELDSKSLEEIIKISWNGGSPKPEFNNAAQAWNHTFYWESMSPSGGGEPTGELKSAIDKAFGSFDEFKKQFSQAGATQFGSGWAWLVKDGSGVAIAKSPNAENPLASGQTPLLTMDVWEHAYYVDFRNRRPDFISNFFGLINWDKVAERYAA